jgi:hypothetical protein
LPAADFKVSEVLAFQEPRRHIIFFTDKAFPIDVAKVREIYIDATYNTSKIKTHLYSIVAQELGYSVPFAFMLMEIHEKEDTKSRKHHGEALQCNREFYSAAKERGLQPQFVHTDKDWSEISAAKVESLPLSLEYFLYTAERLEE